MATKKPNRKELLATITAATNSAQGYALVDPSHIKELVADGHVEVNTAITSEDGKVAARATGVALPVAPAKASFDIESGIVPTPQARGGKKEEVYPFGQLEVGQSFFVPATDKSPDPAKTFASTVSSATRRFAVKSETETKTNKHGKVVPVLVVTRRFTIRTVTPGQKYENGYTEAATGARVFRIA